jgi:hypothetical protein
MQFHERSFELNDFCLDGTLNVFIQAHEVYLRLLKIFLVGTKNVPAQKRPKMMNFMNQYLK